MLIDTRFLPADHLFQTDVCIVGAGAAGVTLAREFVGEPFRVCLLASGGCWTQDAAARDLVLEGMDPADFSSRPWVSESGWPFGARELAPYYRRARRRYGLEGGLAPVPAASALVGDRVAWGSATVADTNDARLHQQAVAAAPNIDVLQHATAVELEVGGSHRTVARLHLVCDGGKRLAVGARLFILALGGLENPRLLLASNRLYVDGVGNWYDLVGRYLAVHARLRTAVFRAREAGGGGLADEVPARPGVARPSVRPVLRLTPQTLEDEEVGHVHVQFTPSPPESQSEAVAALVSLAHKLRTSDLADWDLMPHLQTIASDPVAVLRCVARMARTGTTLSRDTFWLESAIEQSAGWNNRVLLVRDRDAHEMPRVRVRWRLRGSELRTLQRTHAILREDLSQGGLGTLTVRNGIVASVRPVEPAAAIHHLGTTRMHALASKGVVDESGRVHGIENLYVTGSSVFPSGGAAHPMLTVMALAIRLADQVKRCLRRPEAGFAAPGEGLDPAVGTLSTGT